MEEKIFAKRLKELRAFTQKKQAEVAQALEISATCYAGYEQGYREPDFFTLKKICRFFDVPSDYLLGLIDEY